MSRIDGVKFPINPNEIELYNQKRSHTEYGQFYYYRTFGKFCALYKLLSVEKDITDTTLASQLRESLCINDNGDCAIQLDKRGHYKNEHLGGKKYTGLIHLISQKILEGRISQEHGYYILCRISDNYDYKGQTKESVETILRKNF